GPQAPTRRATEQQIRREDALQCGSLLGLWRRGFQLFAGELAQEVVKPKATLSSRVLSASIVLQQLRIDQPTGRSRTRAQGRGGSRVRVRGRRVRGHCGVEHRGADPRGEVRRAEQTEELKQSLLRRPQTPVAKREAEPNIISALSTEDGERPFATQLDRKSTR